MQFDCPPKICHSGGSGLLLPLGGEFEVGLPDTLKVVLYLAGLLYCFMGVAIVADVFMGAIEKITSIKKRVKNPESGKLVTVKVWNDTVANLTLMALGSSAPEILLSVIGIFQDNFYSGVLGPSTIVGSAAFNLLCITAVCVLAIPDGELRLINDRAVFNITAFFSVFAYVWLLIILIGPTKDVVDVFEGIMSFFFFPILVVLAFLADVGLLPGTNKPPPASKVYQESTQDELATMELKVRQKYGEMHNLTSDQVSVLIAYEFGTPSTRAAHRVNATRGLFAGKKLFEGDNPWMTGRKLSMELMAKFAKTECKGTRCSQKELPCLQFKALNYTVLESVGQLKVKVGRSGNLSMAVSCNYKTRDGTAKADDDYTPLNGKLDFAPGETDKEISVSIVHSSGSVEETEEFYIDLALEPDALGVLGDIKTATVVVIDEDMPGIFLFAEEQLEVMESIDVVPVTVKVKRKGGSSGKVSCSYATEDGSAVGGPDYVKAEGVLEFEPGQCEASIIIEIQPKGACEGDEDFRVIINEATGGATFDQTTDGGVAQCIMTIIIKSDPEAKTKCQAVMKHFNVNMDQMSAGHANWKSQFVAAVYCGGSREAQAEAKPAEWVMHIIGLPWKFLFASCPPPDFLGGWCCFVVALGMIGMVTGIIGDMAGLLGCAIGIPDSITAITFVALGTSLPDTFASKTAAQQDPFADASIGNVTGSNSVNVFLGLGLPWMMGALYWNFMVQRQDGDEWSIKYPDFISEYPDGAFVVKAGGLGVSVATFSVCACICIAVLVLRRKVVGGELGGPKSSAKATACGFVSLWFVYIGVSCWYTLSNPGPCD